MGSQTVFGNYELLEHILLFLSLRDLLISQRVNKACFDVVQQSSDIRQALFLEPTTRPLYVELYQGGPDEDFYTSHLYYDDKRVKASPPIVNPFIIVRNTDDDDGNMAGGMRQALGEDRFMLWEWRVGSILGFGCWHEIPGLTIPHTDSRDKMLLTQGPIGLLHVDDFEVRSIVEVRGDNGGGVPQDRLRRRMALDWTSQSREQLKMIGAGSMKLWEAKLAMRFVRGGETWMRAAKTVDEITGYEMLWLLDASEKDRKSECMLRVGGYDRGFDDDPIEYDSDDDGGEDGVSEADDDYSDWYDCDSDVSDGWEAKEHFNLRAIKSL